MAFEIDRQSSTWKAVMAWADERLQQQRLRNEGLSLNMEQTCITRGRIAELKALLALDNPDPAQVADEA